MKGRAIIAIGLWLLCGRCVFALNPALNINQYAHTSWRIPEGAFKGTIYSIAQTPDGYLWLGTEFGLLRFDGNRSVPWQPPEGQHLPGRSITRILAARDGTLWIGTDAGLASWKGAKLTMHPELDAQLVASLLEDRTGTVWAAGLGVPTGRLCAIRAGNTQCDGGDGAFGQMVLSLYEDTTGNLWAGTQSGLWRWKPGPPTHFAMPPGQLHDLTKGDEGELLIAMPGGIKRLVQGRSEPYTVQGFKEPFNANRLLWDRDGSLWIGTLDRGLIHVHQGRAAVFSQSDGLSGNVIFSLFQDREGNVWAATNGGLDRFREFPAITVSVKQGLSTDNDWSVLAARDGSIWVGGANGLNRWNNGQVTIFRKSSGLADDAAQSLFEDDRGRIWAFARHGLAYFANGRFVSVNSVPGGEAHFIAGGQAGNLWVSEHQSLLHLRAGRLVERIPWSQLGRQENASVLEPDRQGGMWLGFWRGGGVAYFKDGKIHATYSTAQGLGESAVAGLTLGQDGSLWAATEGGGLGWIKAGRVATLTTRNGLPCDIVHWAMEDDSHSLWLYTACGLLRIARTELSAWIANPNHRIETTVWDAADGVRLRSTSPSGYSPRVARSTDGKLWFVTGNGVNVVDPRHLATNRLPPPVHIEQVTAGRKVRWQNLSSAAASNPARPALTGDLEIDYTALSFVAPEKIRFKYMLEGKDHEWQDAGNRRQAFYTNLPPRDYRFRVIACNDSGVWNEAGAAFDFSITPAFYQTLGFKAACAAATLLLLWGLHRIRVHQVAREIRAHLEGRTDERLMVARELHDTLLQSFHGLLLQFQAARNLLRGRADDAAQVLDTAIDGAARAITEARNTVQDMRSSTVITNELAQAVELLGKGLAEEQSANGDAASFSIRVEGTSHELHPILRDEVYRITAEALRNAFRHARARRIEVEIMYDARRLRVRVRDDGIGMDAGVLKDGRAGHWGLQGMRERAKGIGGQLEVWSGHGAGTEMELTIPGSVAYGGETSRHSRLPNSKSESNS
ncbi:MAG TPA: two-component regulator propeller domain-containing protein [Bryobacteraceae bacterium]|nr:two-component regulator propeller domain-containing protein [Bryobacteraceae bacterium]